jgi:hypothetical protein
MLEQDTHSALRPGDFKLHGLTRCVSMKLDSELFQGHFAHYSVKVGSKLLEDYFAR